MTGGTRRGGRAGESGGSSSGGMCQHLTDTPEHGRERKKGRYLRHAPAGLVGALVVVERLPGLRVDYGGDVWVLPPAAAGSSRCGRCMCRCRGVGAAVVDLRPAPAGQPVSVSYTQQCSAGVCHLLQPDFPVAVL